MVFEPDDVQRLRYHNLPIVGGVYPKKGGGNFAWRLSSGKHEILLGKGGGIIPVVYIETDFLYTQQIVYEKSRSISSCLIVRTTLCLILILSVLIFRMVT